MIHTKGWRILGTQDGILMDSICIFCSNFFKNVRWNIRRKKFAKDSPSQEVRSRKSSLEMFGKFFLDREERLLLSDDLMS